MINSSNIRAVCTTINGDILISSDGSIMRVNKALMNSTNVTLMLSLCRCYDIFVDASDTFYCLLGDSNQVVSKSLKSTTGVLTVVAGTGLCSFASDTLCNPWGMFVDTNSDLYVADCGNDRIQLFQAGKLNATTVAGNGSSVIVDLNCPADIVLDADKYLFILDSNNNRVIRQGPYGFQCIVGCTSSINASSNQLSGPSALSFDSYGNIFVDDQTNNRIQKFLLNINLCNESTTTMTMTTTVTLTPSSVAENIQTSASKTVPINPSKVVSYNQPKLSACTMWNSNGTTFATGSTIGSPLFNIYITTNNTIYVANQQNGEIHLWYDANVNLTEIIHGSWSSSLSFFVTISGDIYIANNSINCWINKWVSYTNSSLTVTYLGQGCISIFIDINETLYCSMPIYSQVVAKSFNSISDPVRIVAGAGCSGSSSDMLADQSGIFVDIDFDLYVADSGNNRIQLFQSGDRNAITVAGNTSPIPTIDLNYPTGIILDADKYLFIADSGNSRIVGQGPNGFRCIVGCNGSGSASDQLLFPQSLSFDSYGNLFVVDTNNSRIQKFVLLTNSCDETTIVPTTTQIPQDQTTSVETPADNQTCFSSKMTLIPMGSAVSNPIQFRRSQNIYITSIIQFHCNDSLLTTTQWLVRNCANNCSQQVQLDPTIPTTFSELYIPARKLPYGTYELELTAIMNNFSSFKTSSSSYIQVVPSDITVNLVQLGTSMISSGYEQDLNLDPGTYSIDPNENSFNSTNWIYKYYCRIYGLYDFHQLNSSLNLSCLSNRTGWRFGNSFRSSLTILTTSLQSNRTYQFMVQIQSRQNSSVQATGFVLVMVTDTRTQTIFIGCVISTMCVADLEYQLLNPSTQTALFSICNGQCAAIQNITWNIYIGTMNLSSNVTEWILFNGTDYYENSWFFGRNTVNFTATKQLFQANSLVQFWRFEVTYSFSTGTSISALDFVINPPPINGTCSISPNNGTTSTLFTISCSDWYDNNRIKDYSLYTSEKLFIAFSSIPTFQVRLPTESDRATLLNLVVSIRDEYDSLIEYNLTSITITPDTAQINELIENIHNPVAQLLSSGNQNTIGQLIISISQQLNRMNMENINKAVANGIPPASISISSLGSQRLSSIGSFNQSVLTDFIQKSNSLATIREYLIKFITNLQITTSDSIKLQSTSLVQLTKATNELTRTTLSLASERSYQLSQALSSISTVTSYEDVQLIASQLFQCTSNILSAVNGPLQKRTEVLDADATRASAFPNDYDTDLESEWSKINLLTDKNSYYQQKLANQIENQAQEILSQLTFALNIHLNLGQLFVIDTSQVFMLLEKIPLSSLPKKQIQLSNNSLVQFGSNFQINTSRNSLILIRSMMEPLAPFGNSELSSNTNVSTVISSTILSLNTDQLSIQTNTSQPIEIIIPRDPNIILPSMTLQNVTSTSSTFHNQFFDLHYANITSSISVSVHLEIHPLNNTLAYLFVYKFDQIPQLNSSINQIDGWTMFCPANLSNDSIYTYFLDNQQTKNHRSFVFGLRQMNPIESITYCSNTSITNPPVTNQRFNFTSNYQLRIYTSGCYYLDENNQWKDDGVRVGPLTNHYQTQCFSTHLTSFAGGFLVLPEPVNWQYIFANADFMRNKTIYLTVIFITLIYILLMIYARYKDKKDLDKLGVTPLPDNHSSDVYFYQILVFTGQRHESGTKSNVHFILCGDYETTSIRTLASPHRSILQRGNIDGFILAVPKSLGYLDCIRIWHDNSGKGSSASWFLKYIIIRDLQTMEKFHFIAQRWFAVEKDDGKIERVLPVASVIEKNEFSYLLSKKAYHNISDDHLWFSIFSRPLSRRFTRVQRCTCCFVLFFLSMFLNIMYYDLSAEAKTNNSTTNNNNLKLGPLIISREQIGIGVMMELLALIPSLLIVQIFRRLGSRRQQSSVRDDPTDKKKKFAFPWWFIFIAYGLCLIVVGVSILFIIARGIEFGDLKTQQWLTSILTGFFSSVLLTQPLKIISLAIFFAFFCRKSDDDVEVDEYFDEETLPTRNPTCSIAPEIIRLNEEQVACARRQRFKEIHMWSLLRETFTYMIYLSLVFIMVYPNRTQHCFLQVQHLEKYLLNIDQTVTINQYWNWLEESFIENLRAQQWYNDDPPKNLSGFINDKSNRLIGWGRIKQSRVQSQLCLRKTMNLTCQSNEETHSFLPGWTNQTTMKSNSTLNRAFQYQDGDGYVYEFRGRLSDLQTNLSALHHYGWIDNRTKFLTIQLSLYNPNVQLFTSVNLFSEVLSTGGIQTKSQIEPIDFYSSLTPTSQLICLIIYMILIVYFMFIEIQSLFRLKWNYIYEFWSWIELGIIICSWIGIAIYIRRYQECSYIGQLFKETNGYVYISLEYLTYLNNYLTFIYAFCCFFGTLKLIRLCRFSSRIYLFIRTLKSAAKELISFTMMFSIIFIAFICLFYLLFQSKIYSASSFLQTAEMLFEMILMMFNTQELSDNAAFLGPICFSLFILIIVFVCLSMFLSIIMNSFRRARDTVYDDEEIYSFMFDRFVRWIGLRKPTEEELHGEYDATIRNESLGPFELLVKKIDELFIVLNDIFIHPRNELA